MSVIKRVPKVPRKKGEEGNTKPPPKKQISPAKYWCFTLNNYTQKQCSSIEEVLTNFDNIDEYIVGYEVGEKCKTPHLQGYVSFKSKTRPVGLFEMKEIHWEKCKGNRKDNLLYCSKCNNIFVTNMKIPKPIKTISKNEMYEWQKEILDMVKCEAEVRKIYWYWGTQGIGKTSFQKYLVVNHDAIMIDGTGTDMKHAVWQYYDKNGVTPELILVNLPFDTDMEMYSYKKLETIKDMLFRSSKYEGGMIAGNEPHLLVFANDPPITLNVKFIVKKI